MKKIVIWLLVWLLCINLCVGIAVAEAVVIPNVLEGFEENESILDICWVNDTLYILGNEAIYSWRFGDRAGPALLAATRDRRISLSGNARPKPQTSTPCGNRQLNFL